MTNKKHPLKLGTRTTVISGAPQHDPLSAILHTPHPDNGRVQTVVYTASVEGQAQLMNFLETNKHFFQLDWERPELLNEEGGLE